MFKVDFYERENGESDILKFLEELRKSSAFNKTSRIQYRKIMLYIQMLRDSGINLPVNIAKHIEGDIWELRPGNNRVLYFFFREDTFVLLHHFRKTTNKTPYREIERAKRERNDYLRRKRK